MAKIFISYARVNRRVAADLVRVITEHGHEVWWDRHLFPGDNYIEKIRIELLSSDAVIVIWSADSVKSQWVCSEAEIARQQNKLIMVATSNLDFEDLPIPFVTMHYCGPNDKKEILEAVERKSGEANDVAPTTKLSIPRYSKPFLFTVQASRFLAVSVAPLIFLFMTGVGYIAGTRDSPDYNNINQAYMFIANHYFVKLEKSGGVSLALNAPPFVYSIPINSTAESEGVVRILDVENADFVVADRYLSSEISSLAAYVSVGAAPATVYQAVKAKADSYGSFIRSSHMVSRASRSVLGKDTRAWRGNWMSSMGLLAMGTGTAFGYWLGYSDKKDYTAKPFREALEDGTIWGPLVTKVDACFKNSNAIDLKTASSSSEYDKSFDNLPSECKILLKRNNFPGQFVFDFSF